MLKDSSAADLFSLLSFFLFHLSSLLLFLSISTLDLEQSHLIAPTPTRFSNYEVNHLTANSLRNFPNSPQLSALDTTDYSYVEDSIIASLNSLASMEPLDSNSHYPLTSTTAQSEDNLPSPLYESPQETPRAQNVSSNYLTTITSSISNPQQSHSTYHSNSTLPSSQALHSTPYSPSFSSIKILHCTPLRGPIGTPITITIASQAHIPPSTSTFDSQSNSLEPFYGSGSTSTSLSSTSTSNSPGTRKFKISFNSLQLPTTLSNSLHAEALGISTREEEAVVVLSALVPERESIASDGEVSTVSIIIEDGAGRIVEEIRIGEWSNSELQQRKSFLLLIFNLNSRYNPFDFPTKLNWIFFFLLA